VAGRVYEIIAERMPERDAAILRRMARPRAVIAGAWKAA
jgi:hypothetical protein